MKDYNLYFIQLFDYNCPNCVSGVTKVFVEDIEEFTRNYQEIEKDSGRVERFLKSKSGEIITDYYSDDPDLNIVQRVSVEDLGYVKYTKREETISVENGYGWPSDYYFGLLVLEVRWIRYKDKFYKLVKPHGFDCAHISPFSLKNPWSCIEVYGNPFWICKGMDEKIYSSDSVESFKGTSLESYVWQVADIFDTEESMNEDKRLMSEQVLTEEQINRVFADIPGDAG